LPFRNLNRRGKILVSGAALLLALLIAEAGLRLSSSDPLSFHPARLRHITRLESVYPYAYHERLGWATVPGKSVNGQSIDARGLRGNGFSSNVRGGSILVLGDSFVYGDEVGDAETWPAHLERILGRTVLNGGVCGYGLDQIVLRGEELIPRLKPALVLVSIIPEDIRRCRLLCRYGAKPCFDIIEQDQLLLKNLPVPYSFFHRPRQLAWDLAGTSFLVDEVLLRIAPEWWRGKHYIREAHQREKELVTPLLRKLKQTVEAHGGKMAFILAAAKPPIQKAGYMPLALESARSLGLPTLDMAGQLLEILDREPEKANQWFAPGGHMTGAGNKWFAEQVGVFLVNLGDI